MAKKSAEPLDTDTTVDMELVSLKSVETWLKLCKQWDGTTKKTPLEKVLMLESFFARVFDPVHFDSFPGLAEAAIQCEDGGADEPGCCGEFHSMMRCCPFCTHSENEEPNQKSDQEIAEFLIKVESTKVRGPGKAPAAAIPTPTVQVKPKAAPLALVKNPPPAPVDDAEEEETEDGDIEGTEEIEPQTNATIATVQELDAAVQRVITTYTATAQNWYECAVELAQIHERQLWRQRRDKDGKPLYEHFNNFVEAELAPRGISRQGAYGLKEFAKKFTREQFEQLGPAKMNVLVSLDAPAREALAEETIKKDLPLVEVRERKEAIRAQAAGAGSSGKGGSSKPGTKAGKPRVQAAPEHDQAFTMVFPSSTFTVATTASKGAGKKPKPAMSLADLPTGEVPGLNGMRMRFVVSEQKGAGIVVNFFLAREPE